MFEESFGSEIVRVSTAKALSELSVTYDPSLPVVVSADAHGLQTNIKAAAPLTKALTAMTETMKASPPHHTALLSCTIFVLDCCVFPSR